MVLNRSSRDSLNQTPVRTPNLKLSGPTSIFCNDRLSQQSSAALPSPVSLWFSLFLVKGFRVSQSFPSSSPHLQTDKNHALFSPYLLATIWVRLLNDLHQLLSPMLGLPRIIIRWQFQRRKSQKHTLPVPIILKIQKQPAILVDPVCITRKTTLIHVHVVNAIFTAIVVVEL
jgi:hypothetical protein